MAPSNVGREPEDPEDNIKGTLETAEVRDDLPLGKRKADCDHLENLVKSLEAGRVYWESW